MKPELLSKFKIKLEKLAEDLKEKIEKLEKAQDFGDDIDSLEEEADETEEFGNRMALAGGHREQLANINSALEKIKEKKYGICEECGKEISEDVLDAAPESKLCKECKKHSH